MTVIDFKERKQQATKPRIKISFIITAGWFIFSGWLLNDSYRYVTEVFYRANVCDETKCLEAQQLAQQMKEMKLPITKERTK